MLRRALIAIGVGSALALEQALRPANVAGVKAPTGSRRVAEDDYQGVERARGGGFMPAGESRPDVWVHQTADQLATREKDVVLAEEAAARATVPGAERKTRAAWHRTLGELRAAGQLHYEGDGDMSDEAREARYGPDWRDLL